MKVHSLAVWSLILGAGHGQAYVPVAPSKRLRHSNGRQRQQSQLMTHPKKLETSSLLLATTTTSSSSSYTLSDAAYQTPNPPPFLSAPSSSPPDDKKKKDWSPATSLLKDRLYENENTDSQQQPFVHVLQTEDDFHALLQQHPDKLVIVKFFAPWCKACTALHPKLRAVQQDPQLQDLPIVWAEMAADRTNTKELFQKKFQVLTLPTIHFYDPSRGGLMENFSCPPNRIPFFKKKLARWVNTRVDPITRTILPYAIEEGGGGDQEGETRVGELQSPKASSSSYLSSLTPPIMTPPSTTAARPDATPPRVKRRVVDNELITDEHMDFLRHGMPFFQDLTDHQFDTMISKAKLLSFNPGDVIVRQGMKGDCFYVIKSGQVEMHIRGRFEDPLSTPADYLGVHVATLTKFDYFGERALTTGEPLSASFRVLEKTRCFAFGVHDIPEASILSKNRKATQDFVEQLNRRYVLPQDYTPPATAVSTAKDESILDLLMQFQQIRQASKWFDYVVQVAQPHWGDVGEIGRRTLLVRKLSTAQREEYVKVFDLVDVHQRGVVTLGALRRFLSSAKRRHDDDDDDDEKVDSNKTTTTSRSNWNPTATTPNLVEPPEDLTEISRDEFLGVMAEAEFYHLFKETFHQLDVDGTGYVRAGDLDDILGGVRDLIAVESTRSSIIDVDNRDMLVDYEQFSKMLLGAAL